MNILNDHINKYIIRHRPCMNITKLTKKIMNKMSESQIFAFNVCHLLDKNILQKIYNKEPLDREDKINFFQKLIDNNDSIFFSSTDIGSKYIKSVMSKEIDDSVIEQYENSYKIFYIDILYNDELKSVLKY